MLVKITPVKDFVFSPRNTSTKKTFSIKSHTSISYITRAKVQGKLFFLHNSEIFFKFFSFQNTPEGYCSNQSTLVRSSKLLMVTCKAIVKTHNRNSHPSLRCSKSTIKTLEQGKKKVQS